MTRPIKRRQAISGLAVMVAGLAAPHVARAAVRVVRLGHNNTDVSHYGQGAAALAAAVAADQTLGGVLKIDVRGNAELGDELGMLKGCIAGTLDLMICSNSPIGNVVPEFGLLNAPFVFRDTTAARTALDGALGAEFSRLAAAKNLQVLAWSENGMRQITSNVPVRRPDDLRGVKIRVPQSDVMLGGFRALGADAAPLSFGLLREALRTGQFQAQENPIVVIEAAKLFEMQKFLSLTGHIYDPAVYAISADLSEDLTEPQRAALSMCAARAAAVTRQAADLAQREGITRLKAAGMTVVEDVDVAGFRAASQPYLNSLSKTYGAERMQRLMAAGA